MTEATHLKITSKDQILTCEMSNPGRHTLNRATLQEMAALVDRLSRDTSIRVFILTGGEEGYFFKHFELTELAEEKKENIPQPSTIHTLCRAIQALPQITIAAINGVAGGGAVELSLAFDFRLMATGDPTYTFGSPQTTFGIVPCGGASAHYVRMLGPALAMDLLVHGELMPPERALALGLVSRVYPKESFRAEVASFARNITSRAPLAMQGIKRLVLANVDASFEEAQMNEVHEYNKVINTDDARRALAAVLADPNNCTVPFYGR